MSTTVEPASAPIRSVSWILLTQGDRPDQLRDAIASIPSAGRTGAEVIVIANGASGVAAVPGARLIELDQNVGIPAGRNAGAGEAHGDLLVFLDDDAVVADSSIIERTVRRFDSEPDLAVVSFRIADPISGKTARRHVPRPGRTDPELSGAATSFLGGACAIRRSAFEQAGGLPGEFFYALEETDLSWRLIDAGWRIHYDGAALVHHPLTEIARHGLSTRRTARNRVLLVRRLLPWSLAPIYLFNWSAITMVRARSWRTVSDHWSGTREGLGAKVDRRPIKWKTVWLLSRLGRPPII